MKEVRLGEAAGVEVLFPGQVFCDLVFAGVDAPAPGREVFAEGFALSPGGAANSAVAAARLGARTSLLTDFGDDPLGRLVRAELENEPGLDLGRCIDRTGHQSPVTVALATGSDRSFVTFEEGALPVTWSDSDGPVGAVQVGLGSDQPEWVRRLRGDGTLVVAGAAWDPTGLWSGSHLERLDDADVFIANDVEAVHYARTDSVQNAVVALSRHVALVVVTRGARGVLAFDRDQDVLLAVPAHAVAAVDPTGAGDVFAAAFMVASVWGWPVVERLRLASLAATLSVRSLGGARSAPRAHDLLAFLERGPFGEDWSFVHDWARRTVGASASTPSTLEAAPS